MSSQKVVMDECKQPERVRCEHQGSNLQTIRSASLAPETYCGSGSLLRSHAAIRDDGHRSSREAKRATARNHQPAP